VFHQLGKGGRNINCLLQWCLQCLDVLT